MELWVNRISHSTPAPIYKHNLTHTHTTNNNIRQRKAQQRTSSQQNKCDLGGANQAFAKKYQRNKLARALAHKTKTHTVAWHTNHKAQTNALMHKRTHLQNHTQTQLTNTKCDTKETRRWSFFRLGTHDYVKNMALAERQNVECVCRVVVRCCASSFCIPFGPDTHGAAHLLFWRRELGGGINLSCGTLTKKQVNGSMMMLWRHSTTTTTEFCRAVRFLEISLTGLQGDDGNFDANFGR